MIRVWPKFWSESSLLCINCINVYMAALRPVSSHVLHCHSTSISQPCNTDCLGQQQLKTVPRLDELKSFSLNFSNLRFQDTIYTQWPTQYRDYVDVTLTLTPVQQQNCDVFVQSIQKETGELPVPRANEFHDTEFDFKTLSDIDLAVIYSLSCWNNLPISERHNLELSPSSTDTPIRF